MKYRYLWDDAGQDSTISHWMSEQGKEGFRFVALIPGSRLTSIGAKETTIATVHIIMAKGEIPNKNSQQALDEVMSAVKQATEALR